MKYLYITVVILFYLLTIINLPVYNPGIRNYLKRFDALKFDEGKK